MPIEKAKKAANSLYAAWRSLVAYAGNQPLKIALLVALVATLVAIAYPPWIATSTIVKEPDHLRWSWLSAPPATYNAVALANTDPMAYGALMAKQRQLHWQVFRELHPDEKWADMESTMAFFLRDPSTTIGNEWRKGLYDLYAAIPKHPIYIRRHQELEDQAKALFKDVAYTATYRKSRIYMTILILELLAIWAAYGIVVVAKQLLTPAPPRNQ